MKIKMSKSETARPSARDIARFMRKVRDCKETGAWLWTGKLSAKGYGQFWYKGRAWWAHRFSYLAFVGPLTEGMHVAHVEFPELKHNVNPDHLQEQTVAENVAECNVRRAQSPDDCAPF